MDLVSKWKNGSTELDHMNYAIALYYKYIINKKEFDIANNYDNIKLEIGEGIDEGICKFFREIILKTSNKMIRAECYFYIGKLTGIPSYSHIATDLGFKNASFTGSVHLIMGPMFSGKTTELLRLLNRTKIGGLPVILIKYKNDTRFDEKCIVTHDKQKCFPTKVSSGDSLYNTLIDLFSVQSDPNNRTHVFIDEIQFFIDGAEVCDKLANLGYNVVVCGLSGDFNRNIFPTISKLIPLAENITFLKAIDKKSGKECVNTFRISTETTLEVIGGDDMYQAVDRKNYFSSSSFI